MTRVVRLAALLILLGVPPLSWAATATATIGISANVPTSCTVSTDPVNFGTVSSVTAIAHAAGMIRARCSNSTAYTIAINAGLAPGAIFASRRMLSASGVGLVYSLYTESARTNVWGDGTGGSVLPTGVGTGTTQGYPVYGRIPAGQTVLPGSYTDTVTVTLTF
jgi:spore coat protein U-like protein